jgi:anthranilate phosphoribosyltransferase
MSSPLHEALSHLAAGESLSAELAAGAFGVVMRGEATPAQIGALLLGLRAKGETAEEVAGAVQALRAAMVRVEPGAGAPLVDTCGTGGGRVSTLNLSTAAAFVAAAGGARVAKHGNRSFTSRCGSADVLEALGVDILLPPDRALRALEAAGLVFLYAPAYHPAMRHVGPARKELGVPTIMNLLGPLANPAGVRRQVIGVADERRAALIARALDRLGAEHAMVVHAEIGMDEISPVGRTLVWEVRDHEVREWSLDPEEYGAGWSEVDSLRGGGPEENAALIESLLAGKGPEAASRATALNAGAALYLAGLAPTYDQGVARAREILAAGAALAVLERLRGLAPRQVGAAG